MSNSTQSGESAWTMSLMDCTNVIVNEVRQGLPQRSIAQTYGLALMSEARNVDNPDWKKINSAILERWSMAGLERIKEQAWKLVNQAKDDKGIAVLEAAVAKPRSLPG